LQPAASDQNIRSDKTISYNKFIKLQPVIIVFVDVSATAAAFVRTTKQYLLVTNCSLLQKCLNAKRQHCVSTISNTPVSVTLMSAIDLNDDVNSVVYWCHFVWTNHYWCYNNSLTMYGCLMMQLTLMQAA